MFAERAIDKSTLNAIKVDKRLGIVHIILKYFIFNNRITYYNKEEDFFFHEMLNNKFEDIVESYDDYKINNLAAVIERFIPYQKRIFVEKTDFRLFKNIYNMKGKTIVALVNQWNKPGIEMLWRHTTNTEENKEIINPIGDMDLNKK